MFASSDMNPYESKISFAISPSVIPVHSRTVSSMPISHDASCAQTSIVEVLEVRSRCSRQERTYPSKTQCAEPSSIVRTTLRFVIGSNEPSLT